MRGLKISIIICSAITAQMCFAQRHISRRQKQSNSITVSISFKGATKKDTLYLALADIAYPSSLKYNKGWYAATLMGKTFRFTVPVKENAGYWDLYKNRRITSSLGGTNLFILMQHYYWEAGDNINITVANTEKIVGNRSFCSFSGNGSPKYKARYKADSAYTVPHILASGIQDFDEQMHYHRYDQPAIDKALAELEKFNGKISDLSYAILEADIRFRDEYNIYNRVRNYYNSIKMASDSVKQAFFKAYELYIRQPDTTGIPHRALSESVSYRHHLYNKFYNESYMFYGGYDPERIFRSIIDETSGLLCDRLMIYALYVMPKLKNTDLIFKEAEAAISDSRYAKVLDNLALTMPGRPFPDFDLPDINGKRVKLSDFKGKKVLIDFWFNGCGYCQIFYKNTLSKIEEDFKDDKNVVFISICADATRGFWKSGIQSGDYTSAVAINLNTDGKGFKHPAILKNNIDGFPFVVLLDKDGNISARNEIWLYDYDKLSNALRKP